MPPAEPVNALLQQGDDDPTYEQIVGFYPPFRYPREIVGVPEHRDEIGVDWLGRLDASPWAPPKAWFLVGERPRRRIRQSGVPFKRRLLDGYLPLVTLSREIEGVDHELTVFGWSENFRVETETFAYADVTSRGSTSRLPKQVTFAWGDGDKRRIPMTVATAGRRLPPLQVAGARDGHARSSAAEFDAKFNETADAVAEAHRAGRLGSTSPTLA